MEKDRCQFTYREVHATTSRIWSHYLKTYYNDLKRSIFVRRGLVTVKNVLFPLKLLLDVPSLRFRVYKQVIPKLPRKARTPTPLKPNEVLQLQPGDLVEVRSEAEIRATLDDRDRLRGLGYMPEMSQYCGKRFRVFKRLGNIILETTGEMRRISNTVLLDGVYCDGSFHDGCTRSCFCFWREAWLKRVPEPTDREA